MSDDYKGPLPQLYARSGEVVLVLFFIREKSVYFCKSIKGPVN